MNYGFLLLCAVSLLPAQTFLSVVERLEQLPVERRQPVIERYLNARRVSPIIENDSILHFVLYGRADSVSVVGNLQRWFQPDPMAKIVCGQYSLFYRSYIVPPDSRLDYQLVIDGKYKTDPNNPSTTPSGFGPHSEVRMPRFRSSPFLLRNPEILRGTIDSLPAGNPLPTPLRRYLSAPRPIKVYRPAGFDTLISLPSIYFHDGFEAINYALVPTILDNLIAEGKIPPLIAVFLPPVHRMDEYIGNGRTRFLKYVCETIVPLVDHKYRTDPSPTLRAMAGISAGGTISLSAVLERPQTFLLAASQSGTILHDIRQRTADRFSGGGAPEGIKIYLDCGRYDIVYEGQDFLHLNREYSALLSELRVPHYYKEVNDGHEWANWRERIPEMLIYFFGQQQ